MHIISRLITWSVEWLCWHQWNNCWWFCSCSRCKKVQGTTTSSSLGLGWWSTIYMISPWCTWMGLLFAPPKCFLHSFHNVFPIFLIVHSRWQNMSAFWIVNLYFGLIILKAKKRVHETTGRCRKQQSWMGSGTWWSKSTLGMLYNGLIGTIQYFEIWLVVCSCMWKKYKRIQQHVLLSFKRTKSKWIETKKEK